MWLCSFYSALLDTSVPLLQFQRFRGKINIQRPRKPHYDRALFNAVTKPVYNRPSVTEQCSSKHNQLAVASVPSTQVKRIENPYEQIIAKEVKNWFNNSKMIVIFHVNSISSEEMFNARVQLFKQNIHMKAYNKKVMSQALVGTQYETILPLFDSRNGIVFSPEQNLKKMFKIVKKVPQIMILAGIVEGRLLSKTDLVKYSELPSLDIARAQLASTLQQAAGSSLVTLLQANQTQLTAALDAYASQPNESIKSSTSNPDDDTNAAQWFNVSCKKRTFMRKYM